MSAAMSIIEGRENDIQTQREKYENLRNRVEVSLYQMHTTMTRLREMIPLINDSLDK